MMSLIFAAAIETPWGQERREAPMHRKQKFTKVSSLSFARMSAPAICRPPRIALSKSRRVGRPDRGGDWPFAAKEGCLMSRLVYVLNGPNLNLLGKRQPEIYGRETLADIEKICRLLAGELKLDLTFHQSNREYEIIDWIHEARETAGGIVINPAALTHTSVAILDALNAYDGPVVEVHLSNVHKREAFRHHSYVSLRADGVIAGCGSQGYELALRRVATLIGKKP
jgi:3-dehydroquinate dehydratase II